MELEKPEDKQYRQKAIFSALASLALVFLAYANSFDMDFIGDDLGRIVQVEKYLQNFSTAVLKILPDRPVLMITLWANYQFGQLSMAGYKLVSLLLHAMVGLCLVFLLKEVCPKFKTAWAVPLLTAGLFLTHPLNNQAINSICQRGVVLAALFSIIALQQYIKNLSAPTRQRRLLIFLFTLLAILAKTSASILPLLFIVAGLWKRGHSVKKSLSTAIPFFSLLVVPFFFNFLLGINAQLSALPWYKYFLVQVPVWWLYAKLFIWPTHLHFLYAIEAEPSAFALVLATLAHFAVFYFIYWCRQKEFRSTGFFLTAMYIAFLPESSVLPIKHLFFEHRSYLPLFFFLCAVASLISEYWEPLPKFRRPTASAFILLILSGIVINFNYNKKISTYENWVAYNFSENKDDFAFNAFNLNQLRERKSPGAEEFARRVIASHPQNRIYPVYRDLILFSNWSPGDQLEYLENFSRVLASNSELPVDCRLHFIHFYGSSSQTFFKDQKFMEKMDDFIYKQMDMLRRAPTAFFQVFSFYRSNLIALVRMYMEKSPNERWRYARSILVLEYDFGINDPQLMKIKQDLRKFGDPQLQTIFQAFSTQQKYILPIGGLGSQ